MEKELWKTKIIVFGLSEKAVSSLDSPEFEVYQGSYGNKIDCRNTERNCGQLEYEVPDNLHEYGVLVLSFDGIKTIENYRNRIQKLSSRNISFSFYCNTPATLLNPVPYVCANVILPIFNKRKKPCLKFVFVSGTILDQTPYCVYEQSVNGTNTHSFDVAAYDVFSCGSFEKNGTVIHLAKDLCSSFAVILTKYLDSFVYNRVFYCDEEKRCPLLVNDDGEVVSFFEINKNQYSVFLPEMINPDKKGELIRDLINNVFVDLIPELFSAVRNKKWLEDDRFKSKEELLLIQEINYLELEFQKQKEAIKKKIEVVKKEHAFLIDMISSDSELLVSSVVEFLKWLDFSDVENCDETRKKKEEDIRVQVGQDQLLIEVKGITNLPQERDCNQIDKVVSRRKTPGYQGVIHPVFIVNHEKNTSPNLRNEKPFTNQEIEDSIGMSRSLITTWDMYKAYERIEAGFLSKAYVRECFWKEGHVVFKLPEEKRIGCISRVFHNGIIGCVMINTIGLAEGDVLLYVKDDEWKSITVKRIKKDNLDIQEVKNEEVSIEFNSPVKIGGVIYQRLINEGNEIDE